MGLRFDSVDFIENDNNVLNEGNNENLVDEILNDREIMDELQVMTPISDIIIGQAQNDDDMHFNVDDTESEGNNDDHVDDDEGTDENMEDDEDIIDDIMTPQGAEQLNDKQEEEVMTPNPDDDNVLLFGDVDDENDTDVDDLSVDENDTMQ